MILLPSSSHKLRAVWRGPFTITRCLPHNNYELDLGTCKTILHANILRSFFERETPSTEWTDTAINMIVTEQAADDQRDFTNDLPNPEGGGRPSEVMIGQQLATEQRQRVQELSLIHI